MSTDHLIALLKKNGLKATPQRLAVHEAMTHLGHASADQVAEFIDKKGETKITMASVYNTLCQMALLGIYSYRHSAANKMFFDVCGRDRRRIVRDHREAPEEKAFQRVHDGRIRLKHFVS